MNQFLSYQCTPQKHLIISSSGGNGHIQAAKSKKLDIQQNREKIHADILKILTRLDNFISFLQQEDPKENSALINALKKQRKYIKIESKLVASLMDSSIPEYDLLLDWAPLGKQGVSWNDGYAQNGKIRHQEKLVGLQGVANFIFAPFVFYHLIRALLATGAEHVIDTQAMATKSICRAVRYVNWLNRKAIRIGEKKPITITKVMTDLPTTFATHFYAGIRALSKKDKALLTIQTAPPLINVTKYNKHNEKGEKDIAKLERSFWRAHLGDLSHLKIVYERFPVRQAFFDKILTDRERIYKEGLSIKINQQDEREYLKSILSCDEAKWDKNYSNQKKLTIAAGRNDRIMCLMLGSTGGIAAKEYINNVISKQNPLSGVKQYFYIFCGLRKGGNDLYSEIVDYLQGQRNCNNISSNLFIIPLGAQDAEHIAPIFARSNTLLIRSSGLCSMEVLVATTPDQQILIHSESKGCSKNNMSWFEFLMAGMIKWERGNGCYIIDKRNAMFVNPYRIMELGLNFLMPSDIPYETQFGLEKQDLGNELQIDHAVNSGALLDGFQNPPNFCLSYMSNNKDNEVSMFISNAHQSDCYAQTPHFLERKHYINGP